MQHPGAPQTCKEGAPQDELRGGRGRVNRLVAAGTGQVWDLRVLPSSP